MFNNIDTRSVTFNIIFINVVLFAVSSFKPEIGQYLSLHYFFNNHDYLQRLYAGSINPERFPNLYLLAQELHDRNALGDFLPVQIISHMFMHGGFRHILYNMFGLFMLGSLLEKVWGAQRYLLFYMITGFGAVVLHMLVQGILIYNAIGTINPSMALLEAHPEVWGTYFSTTVGASGAVFGVLAGFATLFPNTELYIMFIPIPVKAKYFVGAYIAYEVVQGFGMYAGDNVAHFAHLGGALFGFLLVKYWNRNNRNSLY
ncbi:MAG TPA: rhomboid family intramembrane serine protease [Chitinophagales bacterium]|nr:rhomboid family intramembrane serine protease [Chitinophagales bacterium]